MVIHLLSSAVSRFVSYLCPILKLRTHHVPPLPAPIQVCPLLLQLLRGHADFPLLVRAMRAVATLLRDFGKQLVDQVDDEVPLATNVTTGRRIH
jgi:hypothetical protein